jgi:hypothetical protein
MAEEVDMSRLRGVATVLLFWVSALAAQTSIPEGTILPVELRTNLNSQKVKAGQAISARIMQDVPLPGGKKIHAGTRVRGRVVQVTPAGGTQGARITLRFDSVEVARRQTAISTNLRAVASAMEVWDAQIPLTGPDRGTPENAWTTIQVGGDEAVYRGGGPVAHGLQAVGEPTYHGVLARGSVRPGSSCDGASDGLQAFWVFASDACGVYGFENMTIAHAGRTDPIGEIVLAARTGEIKVGKGSGMLLRVWESSAR